MNEKDVFIIQPYLKVNKIYKETDLYEAKKLIEAINLNPSLLKLVGLDKINSKTFINSGLVLAPPGSTLFFALLYCYLHQFTHFAKV